MTSTPNDLPAPVDDGAADHLLGLTVPAIPLRSTSGRLIDLSSSGEPWLVLYIYPLTGRPDTALPEGWDMIPGARGCTPQSCAFRDHHDALGRLDATIVGLSVQSSAYQSEMVERLHLPFDVVSDHDRAFGSALNLPTMTVEISPDERAVLYRRLTLIVRAGVIEHVMYPVFPSDQNAAEVVQWLTQCGGTGVL